MKTYGAANEFLSNDLWAIETEERWSDPLFRWFFKKAVQEENSEFYFWTRLGALLLLLLFAPAMALIALAIKLTMPGPIFYRQTRVGKDGVLFEALKFRSMIFNAEEKTGHTLSWEGDPRVTRLGKFLRKSHLDELPQLINALKGEMAFIGPRPERPEFTVVFEKEIPNYAKRHYVLPGITGLAQIACGYDASAREKLEYDLAYIAFRHSITLNLLIAFHTAKKMLFMRSTANIVRKAQTV